jgi:hypothetical protein
MREESSLFSEDQKQEWGIESSPAASEPEEGQETKPDANPEGESQEQPKAEEQEAAQETPPEEGTAETEQEAAEESQTTEGEEKKETPTFDLESFNKFFDKSFEKEDELRSLFEKAEKVTDYDEKVSKISEYESHLQERDERIKELEESLDPLSYFSSPESYKAEMIKKQMPDKDPVLIEKVIKSDLSKETDFDVLVDEFLMDNPGFSGDRTRAANVLMKRHGIDPEDNPEEWDAVTKDELMVDANKARNRFRELADKVELPQAVSPEERAAQKEQALTELKESWKEPIERIAQYDKEVITDDEGNKLFEFTVPDDFKSSIKDYAEGLVTSGEAPANKETLAFLEDTIRKEMIYQNLPKILKVYKSDLESQWQEQKDKEEGNTTPPNKQTAPEGSAEEGKLPGIADMISSLDGSKRETIG